MLSVGDVDPPIVYYGGQSPRFEETRGVPTTDTTNCTHTHTHTQKGKDVHTVNLHIELYIHII